MAMAAKEIHTDIFFKGLENTNSFTMMHNLKYLDISATAVNDLSGIKDNFII